MIIIMIFTVLCIVGLGVSIGLAITNCINKQKSKFKKKIVWILLFAALTLGVIVDEKIPESQMAMLCGISNFVIKLDEPITLRDSKFAEITLPSHMLKLEREVRV